MLGSIGRRIGMKGGDKGAASVCEQERTNAAQTAEQIDPQLDDWELAEDGDQQHHHAHDRVPIVGSAPAEKEVQVVAYNPQDEFTRDNIPVYAASDNKTAPLSSSAVHEISESIEAGTIEHKIATSLSSSMHEISDSVEADTFDHKIASLSFSSAQDETFDSVETGNVDKKPALSSFSSMHEIFESVEADTFDHKIALSPTTFDHEISDSVEDGTIDLKTTSPSASSVQDEISDSVEVGTFDDKSSLLSSSVQNEISDSVEAGTFDHKTAAASSSSVHEISDAIDVGTVDHKTASSSSSMPEGSDFVEVSSIRENSNKSCEALDNQMELELNEDSYRMLQNVGHNNVREAFHLLQNDPTVQRMVISLASDKAVWDALLKNEKVHEFRQSFQQGELKLLETSKDSEKSAFHKENPFFQAIENIKTKVMEFTEKTAEVINQFIAFTDKKILLEKDGDMDRALKASLILFIALLVTAVVRRV